MGPHSFEGGCAMDTEALAQLEKIKRYSRSLKRVFMFLIVMFTLAACVSVLVIVLSGHSPETQRTIDFDGRFAFDWNQAPMTAKVWTIGCLLAVYAIGIKIVYHLAKLFGLYADGHIFTIENVRQIRLVGILLMAFALVWLLTLPIPAMVDTTTAAEASGRMLSIGVGLPAQPAAQLFFGSIVVFVSWVMDVGRRLREENDLIV